MLLGTVRTRVAVCKVRYTIDNTYEINMKEFTNDKKVNMAANSLKCHTVIYLKVSSYFMEPQYFSNSIIICNSNSSLVSHIHFSVNRNALFNIPFQCK